MCLVRSDVAMAQARSACEACIFTQNVPATALRCAGARVPPGTNHASLLQARTMI